MKIEADKLYNFLNKATLGGDIQSANLKIENQQLKVWVKNADTTIAVNAYLNNVVSEDMILPIKDIKILLNSLKLFSSIIEIKVSNNILSIFDKNKQVDIVLAVEGYIDNDLNKELNLDYPVEARARLNSEILKNILKNKTIIKSSNTNISVKDNNLQITTGNKNFDTITERQQLVYPDFSVTFGEPLYSVIDKLDDIVEVRFKSDFPATFKIFCEDYTIQYVVAHVKDLDNN